MELASELSSEGRVTLPGRRIAEREALGVSAERMVCWDVSSLRASDSEFGRRHTSGPEVASCSHSRGLITLSQGSEESEGSETKFNLQVSVAWRQGNLWGRLFCKRPDLARPGTRSWRKQKGGRGRISGLRGAEAALALGRAATWGLGGSGGRARRWGWGGE